MLTLRLLKWTQWWMMSNHIAMQYIKAYSTIDNELCMDKCPLSTNAIYIYIHIEYRSAEK